MLTAHPNPLAGLDPAALFAALAQEKTIGLAVSGGADSLALMLLVAAWPDRPRTIVYTLDHGLRTEAAHEAAMVVEAAHRFGLEARSLRWTETKPEAGMQEAARAARYLLIGQAMAVDGATVLLTAHHLRDQAETVLMRMAHGSGVAGLSGMQERVEVFGVTVVRPLLEVPRETLETIVTRSGLVPAQDPSNADPAYERTRWRNALPGLDALGLTETRLSRLAARLNRIDSMAEAVTDQWLASHASLDPLGVVHIARRTFVSAEAEIGIRALTRAIETVSGQSCTALGQIERLHAGLIAGAITSETLCGAIVHPRRESVLVYREAGRMAVSDLILIQGATAEFDGRFVLSASAPGLVAAPAGAMTREQYQAWAGDDLDIPVAALSAAPVIRDADGRVLAIGTHTRGSALAVQHRALTDRR